MVGLADGHLRVSCWDQGWCEFLSSWVRDPGLLLWLKELCLIRFAFSKSVLLA